MCQSLFAVPFVIVLSWKDGIMPVFGLCLPCSVLLLPSGLCDFIQFCITTVKLKEFGKC